MIEEATARALRESARRFHSADAELRTGRSESRHGVEALATEYVQARREHADNIAEAERQEQILDEGGGTAE